MLPVGGDETIHSDLRVISATHQDLLRLIREGKFRHDLYFRISTFQIDLPALRDRKADIGILAEYFANVLSPAPDGTRSQPSREALKVRWRIETGMATCESYVVRFNTRSS